MNRVGKRMEVTTRLVIFQWRLNSLQLQYRASF